MQKFIRVFILAILLCSSCDTSRRVDKPIDEEYINPKSDHPYTTETYIDKFKGIAIWQMRKYGIPASITLAQAILESSSGNSELARVAKNHFGIKCNNNWNGKTYLKDDERKNECFRMYKNESESFKDHAEFLKRDRYASLFTIDNNDYIEWARGLKKAGYATNPHYPDLLIGLIQRYKLYQYDKVAMGKRKKDDIYY